MATANHSVGVLTIAPEASSVAAARRFVEQRLAVIGLPDELIDIAVLLTSELVTNAVIHAGTDVEVRVGVGTGVLVEVRDQTKHLPVQRSHPDDAVGGRGLELVELLADNYGVVPIAGVGKSVWFVVGDPGGAAAAGSWDSIEPASLTSCRVVLHQLPLVLYDVMREHHEALLREYTIQLLDAAGPRSPILKDVAAVDRSRQMVAAAVAARRRRTATPSTITHLDLPLDVSLDNVPGVEAFANVFSAAEEQAVAGRLLTRPALPEIAALRRWLFGQIVHQLHGGKPAAWEFTDHPTAPGQEPVDIDTDWVTSTEQAVIVGDDANQIVAVSAAAAALLGWTPAALTGQRLTVVIPSRLREAHIGGFTRQLVTGRRVLLDRPIELPALHRDGHEVALSVTLRKQAQGGRAIFTAWLSPARGNPTPAGPRASVRQ